MIKRVPLSHDKSMNKKAGKTQSSQGKDLRNVFIPCKKTIKKQKSKISICLQNKIPLNPEIKDNAVTITEYLKTKASQGIGQIKSKHLNKQMRELVVSWIVEVAHKLKMKSQTLFHSIYLLDRILESDKNMTLENFQLLGTACLFVSSKYQEIYPPRAELYAEVTDFCYSKKKILDMETAILANMKFQLTFPTRYTFLTHICSPKEKRLFNLALYILELSLLILWEDVSENEIAEAALFLSSKVLKKQHNGCKRTYQIAWKLMKVWNQYHGGIISYIFDCDEYSFVGGIFLEKVKQIDLL